MKEKNIVEGTNASKLDIIANIYMVISVISAIFIWITQSTIKTDKGYLGTTVTTINWWGIIGGIATLFSGLTIYFLFKTIVEIYCEVEKDGKKKSILKDGRLWVGIILVLLIMLPMLYNATEGLRESKLEYNLLLQGKTVSASDIAEKFAKLLSEKKYDEAENYLSEDCILIDSKNKERAKLEYCFEKLNPYNSHRIEKRGNDLKNQETYRIYWNGTKYEKTNQIITLLMQKKVKKDEITYEIYKINFTDNTLLY